MIWMIDRIEHIRKFYEEAFYQRLVNAGYSEAHARAEAERISKRLQAIERID